MAARSAIGRAVPFGFVLVAIILAAAAGITYVISPNWGKHNAQAAARDVGRGHGPGKQVPFVSPREILIPKLAVKAPVVKIGQNADHELDIPLNPKITGWWRGGVHPGAPRGTAIIAGHINYSGVTGVLARIGTLNPGDKVYLKGFHHARKLRLTFRVTGVRTYRKTALPYRKIFNQHSRSRLVLVTCGGPFDAATGNYQDNIVAFAVPAGSRKVRA